MRRLLQRTTPPVDDREFVVDGNRRVVAIELRRGDVLGLENPRGAAVHLCTGQLWITQQDDFRDIIVDAGHGFRLDRDGLALVSATTDATLMIEPSGGSRLERLRFERA